MSKRTIEGLLTWAFTEELCKVANPAPKGAAPSGSSGMAQYVEYGTIIDRSPNAFGVIPTFMDEGEPHPDALLIGRLVREIGTGDGFEIGAGWYPFPDWQDPQGLVRAEVERVIGEYAEKDGRANGKHVANLVITAAILKRGPDWRADEPRTQAVIDVNGKALWFVRKTARDRTGKRYAYEDNGYDRVKKRPMKGAYRKWRLEHSVRAAIISRLDWQLWQSALETLRESLAGRPQFADLAPFVPDRHPWTRARKAA